MSRGGGKGKEELVTSDIKWLLEQHPNMIWATAPGIDRTKVTKAQEKFFTAENGNSMVRYTQLTNCLSLTAPSFFLYDEQLWSLIWRGAANLR